MQSIIAGTFSSGVDYDTTLQCLRNGLDRGMKRNCSQIAGMSLYSSGSLLFFQGIPIHIYPMNGTSGFRQSNGTWTENLGLLQSGTVDMWSTYATMTLPRYNDFIFTTAFAVGRYGALMKRQETLSVKTSHVTAGIHIHMYAAMIAIFTLLFAICLLNERVHRNVGRNSYWHLLLSTFPLNGQMVPYQTGVTRKVLIATSGFGVLMLSSLYQAKQAEALMIPSHPPVVTLHDIERYVSSGSAQLMFEYPQAPVMSHVERASQVLNESIHTRPPIYGDNDVLGVINNHNAILFGARIVLLTQLNKLPPHECANYVFVVFENWTRFYLGLIIRKQRRELLEWMNVKVAQRVSYVDNYVQSFQMSDECRKYIFPVYTPDPRYYPLILGDFVAMFGLLAMMLCVSGIVLVGEVIWQMFHRKKQLVDNIKMPFEFYINLGDEVSENTRQEIQLHCAEILRLLENEKCT